MFAIRKSGEERVVGQTQLAEPSLVVGSRQIVSNPFHRMTIGGGVAETVHAARSRTIFSAMGCLL